MLKPSKLKYTMNLIKQSKQAKDDNKKLINQEEKNSVQGSINIDNT